VRSATEHLRALAGAIVDRTIELAPVRAALLAGSAGRGEADHFSDIDLIFYVEQIPPQDVGARVREAVGGTESFRRGEPTEHFSAEEFDLKGVRVEVAFTTVGWMEQRLDELLDRLVDFDAPSQKILSGLLEGVPLYGRELIGGWSARVAHYPEAMRLAVVRRYWSFFPLWYEGAALAKRDAELWRLDMLLEAAFNLLGVLAGLNRLYFTRFQFKRTRAYISRMKVAPDRLADRLESLFRLEPESAAAELGRLVQETLALVEAELPGFDTGMRFPPGTRHQPWSA
jgi:predicted nucleotidyltransferase